MEDLIRDNGQTPLAEDLKVEQVTYDFAAERDEYRLGNNDVLNIFVLNHPELSSQRVELGQISGTTVRKDGMPSLSVVWFDLDPEEDVVIVNTLAGRLKHRHLERDPRVSLCFEDEANYLTIEGRAELSPDPGMAGIWALAHRYGEGEGSFAKGDRITIRIRVERVIWHP